MYVLRGGNTMRIQRTMQRLYSVASHLQLVILLLGTLASFAQGPVADTKPRTPTLVRTIVNPTTGAVTIEWKAAPSTPNAPNATGYIIYKRVKNAAGIEQNVVVEEVDATTFSYEDLNAKANEGSVTYAIAAKGPDEPSALTDYHHTIFVKLEYEECRDRVKLSWNPYGGWGNRVEQYVIYGGSSAAWEDFTPIKELKGIETEYTFSVPVNKQLYYYIHAKRKGADDITRSNLVMVRTREQRLPSKLVVDTIFGLPQANRVTFTIDSTSRLAYYKMVRTDTEKELQGKLNSVEVARFTSAKLTSILDTVNGRDIQVRRRFYHLEAVDDCGEIVDTSRAVNSITLRVLHKNKEVTVTWDELHLLSGNTAEYRIYRKALVGNTSPNEDGDEIATVHSWEPLIYKDDLSSYKGKGSSGRFCYYIKGWELKGQERIRLSISSEQCTKLRPQVLLPTAIAPLERGVVNPFTTNTRNVFRPVTSYKSKFKLIVYNRQGAVIYTGDNVGWNGTLADGSYAPEGAYIYRIEILSEEYSPQVETGSFMVVYPEKQNK